MQPANKKILLTGGGGFLGKIIKRSLEQKGYVVKTLGRSQQNDIVCDLAKDIPALSDEFEFIVHNAGKAHVVPANDRQAREFFDINVKGTEHLLQAVSNLTVWPQSIVFISSIAVYGLASGNKVPETHPLQATDPYGKSKIEAEKLIASWSEAHQVNYTLLRLPLLVGSDAPGNLGAMIKGIKKGVYFGIGESNARKSMVMAEDVANIIPRAAEAGGIYNLTDGFHPSFKELENIISRHLRVKTPAKLPVSIAKLLGLAGDMIDTVLPGKAPVTTKKIEKIISTLTFDDSKARQELDWKPRPVLDAFTI